MTNNQISYFKATEEKRHNLATEEEAHNNNLRVAKETNRHNIAVETEAGRSNLANEAIGREGNAINDWRNKVTATETNRHNAAMEDLQRLSNTRQHEANLNAQESNAIKRELGYINAGLTERNLGISSLLASASQQQAAAALKNADSTARRTTTQNLVDRRTLRSNVNNTQARTQLVKEQAESESSKRFVNYVRGATSLITPISMAFGGVK